METINSILKKVFGYDTFRTSQKEIIENVLNNYNTLALMPTGGGKSLCFQIPAILMEGTAIVISPLIALMKDQVDSLTSNGISASYLNSTLPYNIQATIENECLQGKIKLLYVSPEKLLTSGFSDFLNKIKINLFAIDEAHCVSFWGHDFRPEYNQLKKILQQFTKVPVLALTATADKVTRKDILKQLGIEDATIFISTFDRPNISLTSYPGIKRIEKILEFLKQRKDQPGIIYCLTRKTCEEIALKLIKAGYKAKHYHAGMDHQYRTKTQEEFLKDDLQIICATIAFGMGIDKSNVRWVIHYNMPKNIESFYQEIGRAGRDGMPAETLLFYTFNDYMMQVDMLKDLPPERKELQTAKLDRMKQYAEADGCRRRILISYFNESYDKDCGNCDVCKNPPSKFDATLLAQKALSGIARTNQQVSMSTLVDILRGSRNKSILEKSYQELRTFGVGRELRIEEWSHYLVQLLNSGYLDIAYDEGHNLKLNSLSWDVLKKGKKVSLVKFISHIEKKKKVEEITSAKPKKEVFADKLFERLKKLRKEIADKKNVPAYIIFNDSSLADMSKLRPTAEIDMLNIQGVGIQKFNLYGEYFLNEINKFIKEEYQSGIHIEGGTFIATLDLYNQGLNVSEIASLRNLNPVTIISHLCSLYEKGHQVDLKKYIEDNELNSIQQAILKIKPEKNVLKPVFEYLDGKVDYAKIRIAATLLQKNSS